MSESNEPHESPGEESHAPTRTAVKPRVWPGVLAVVLLWCAIILPNWIAPESPASFVAMSLGIFASLALIAVWWLFVSRVPWGDRLVGLAVMLIGLGTGATLWFHPTLPGVGLVFYVLPWLLTAVVATLLITRPLGWARARWAALLVALVGLGVAGSIRYDGVDGNFNASFLPRWQPDSEERLLASLEGASAGPAVAPEEEVTLSEGDWPGFRGPGRDGHVARGSLAADWTGEGLREVWRRAVGPGWGSFCLVDGRLYTQEQRGEEECVVCYDAATGDQLWSTGVEARFYESISQAGPRGTPTFFDGAVYSTGAEGDVQCMDAATGEVKWRRGFVDDTQREKAPDWGFASSPLVLELEPGKAAALVFAGNKKPESEEAPSPNEAVIAYDADTGDILWKGGVGDHGYSSPHRATLGGVPQVLMSSNAGLESLDPATGERVWFYDWNIREFARSIQPLVVDDETVVLSAGYDSGTQAIRVTNDDGEWSTDMLWHSTDLLPYFNDMVLYQDHLYGFHKKFFTCMDVNTGQITWPRSVRRDAQLGHGQVVLDPGSGRLLATTETDGEVVLIQANPETYVELARAKVLGDDPCWNHPIIAHGRLYVRNGKEAACYELPGVEVAGRR